MEVTNKLRKYSYFNRTTGLMHQNIWDFLTVSNIRKANLSAHDFNTLSFVDRPDQYKEVIPGIIPIPPRSRWQYNGEVFISANSPYISPNTNVNFQEFLETCEKLLSVLKKTPIGIDLSGGVDTSIIIGLLKKIGIKPLLVGIKNSRYEFRTESVIQDIFANEFGATLLLQNNENTALSNLLTTPLHQLPTCTSLFHSLANQLAVKYKENGIKTVLNGNGLDELLCDCPIMDGALRHPEAWFTWMLDNNWLNEYVFNSYGINYIPATASKLLIRLIWVMRKGEKEDAKKLWARRLFANLLPAELVNYTYKADHVGVYMEGLWKSINEIRELFRVTYDITKYVEFKESSLHELLKDLQTNDDNQGKIIRSRISFANWIYGLSRDNFC